MDIDYRGRALEVSEVVWQLVECWGIVIVYAEWDHQRQETNLFKAVNI